MPIKNRTEHPQNGASIKRKHRNFHFILKVKDMTFSLLFRTTFQIDCTVKDILAEHDAHKTSRGNEISGIMISVYCNLRKSPLFKEIECFFGQHSRAPSNNKSQTNTIRIVSILIS